jgi:hypothetical protein
VRGLWFVAIVLVVLWVIGSAVNVGAIVWLLLIAALVILVFNLIAMRRTGRWR